ncbi:unnamed protein product [Lactuca virosa]|uniref:Peptide N-acetyl-beta-D-glucosaminyl asparaginase amidase A N-terminal domain-containing protein n=1 Tax=Lactuca virosa TaxID=75947 RepID=A0AAU9N418_9ASTR|nr:unnamed protein product [Lactuca virosa]
MDFTFLPFILLFLLLSFSIISAANPIPKAVIFQQHLTSKPTTTATNGIPPTTYFEITKPIQLPNTKPCSTLLLRHEFGNSYGIPPASTQYTRPSNCPSTNFAKIVLEWNATCKDQDHGYKEWADLIIPISQNIPLDDALWFKIYNSNDVKTKQFVIPPNAYRAVLEVYVSVDEADVLWPRNLPNDYISSNNLTGRPAINPYLWGQISAIGSFALPSYDIEITPLLGSLLNGKLHDFAFGVTNGLNVWLIDANLHVWLDAKSEKTKGMLLNQTISPLHESLKSNFMGFNGTFVTSVHRSIKSSGWVESSFGKIVTESTQDFNLSNIMVMGNDGGSQTVNQTIEFNDKVASSVHNTKSLKSFYFYLYSERVDNGDRNQEEVENVTLGFNEKKIDNFGSKSSSSVLENLQNIHGSMILKDNVVVSGLGSSQQNYSYSDDKFCYFRNISRISFTIIYDKVGDTCSKPKNQDSIFNG